MPISLEQLNSAPVTEALQLLDGLYEHSPWIAEAALAQRPFQSVHQLKYIMTQVLAAAPRESQVALIRAHPELAGKAMVSQSLTTESTNEQSKAGLTHCSAEEFAKLQMLNADYNAKFGWPFILAVRGARGTGLSRAEIIATFERRLGGHPDFELQECLRNIHRIAEIRLNDKFDLIPAIGNAVWDWHDALAEFSEPGYAEQGQLTVTYLSDAHRACAQRIQGWMLECGFDSAQIDTVGNVVGRYEADPPSRHSPAATPDDSEISRCQFNQDISYSPKTYVNRKTLLTGSHYDTVRNAGKYDGRLGIFVPMACVRELHRAGRRLPYALEVVAFAEEEGQRFKATFLGSGALTGDFKPDWLDQQDSDGITMLAAMQHAGRCNAAASHADVLAAIAQLKRDPAPYLGFVEVHIEQGPVLNAHEPAAGRSHFDQRQCALQRRGGRSRLPRRYHADAAAPGRRLRRGRTGLVPGAAGRAGRRFSRHHGPAQRARWQRQCGAWARCVFSLDLRAPNDLQRNKLEHDVLEKLQHICRQRGLTYTLQETLRASAAPSAQALQQHWEAAVTALGLPVHRLPSGAGHDAMKLHEVMPQAMLFVRGQNAGISHNPLETTTSDDMQLAVQALMHCLDSIDTGG
jgi:N-carbamoyl-L-amino-acid hydrolase